MHVGREGDAASKFVFLGRCFKQNKKEVLNLNVR